jgi:drug/metabolite transporter (DMT)-like permease
MWVIYSIVVLYLQGRYAPLMITRKVFFYGVLTLIPYFCFVEPFELSTATLFKPVVAGNLLFLGILASLICYWTWNMVIEKLGAVHATNYLYINPIVAMITARIVLNEQITPLAIVGTILILSGVYLAERGKQKSRNIASTTSEQA